MPEVGDHLFNHFFHAVKFSKGGINFDNFVGKNPGAPRIMAGIDQFRLANGGQQTLGGRGKSQFVVTANFEIFL